MHRQLRVEVWLPRDVCHNEREALNMKKTQIIKQIVGERIKEYGFTYLKTDGPCRIFVREVQGIKRYYDPENQVVKQYINIQESSFSQSLIARFHTDAFGYEIDQEIEELKKYGTGGWISYLDEENFKEKLRLLADLTVEYGLDLLEKMSHEEEAIPTKAMAEKLFEEHKQLAYSFSERYHIKTKLVQPEDVDEWLSRVKKILMNIADLPYEEAKELLVEIAAFMGEKVCEICSYRWEFTEYYKTPQVVGDCLSPNFWPLDVVINIWRGNESHWIFMEKYGQVLKKGMVK